MVIAGQKKSWMEIWGQGDILEGIIAMLSCCKWIGKMLIHSLNTGS